jgi:hypothetical protein
MGANASTGYGRHTFAACRSNGHRSPIASLDRIVELAQTLAPLLEDAADAGGRKSRGAIGENERGKGFTDSDPTSSTALDPTRRQMRAAVHRLDHDEWVRVVEKRSAALAPVSPTISPRRLGAGSTGHHEDH